MERDTGISEDELSTEVTMDGVKLIVIASRIEIEEWQLSIKNEHGICTCWLEYFSTAQMAIDAGLISIQNEGIEAFIDTDGFGYLFEENV